MDESLPTWALANSCLQILRLAKHLLIPEEGVTIQLWDEHVGPMSFIYQCVVMVFALLSHERGSLISKRIILTTDGTR